MVHFKFVGPINMDEEKPHDPDNIPLSIVEYLEEQLEDGWFPVSVFRDGNACQFLLKSVGRDE